MCRWVDCLRGQGGQTCNESLLDCSLGRGRALRDLRPQERVDWILLPSSCWNEKDALIQNLIVLVVSGHNSSWEGQYLGVLVDGLGCVRTRCSEHSPAPSAPSVLPDTVPGY